jgi:hypothetical protein
MLEDLNARFVWTADKRDKWTIMKAVEGPLTGDCEDYALTALWLLSGRSWLRLWWMVITWRAIVWNVRHAGYGPGRGNHVALWVTGRGWIDSSIPHWAPSTPHSKRFPYVAPLLALRVAFSR